MGKAALLCPGWLPGDHALSCVTPVGSKIAMGYIHPLGSFLVYHRGLWLEGPQLWVLAKLFILHKKIENEWAWSGVLQPPHCGHLGPAHPWCWELSVHCRTLTDLHPLDSHITPFPYVTTKNANVRWERQGHPWLRAPGLNPTFLMGAIWCPTMRPWILGGWNSVFFLRVKCRYASSI